MESLMGTNLIEGIVKAFNLVTTKSEVSGNVTHDFNIKGDGVGSLTQTEFNKFFLESLTDPTIKTQFEKRYGTSNVGLLTTP
jgi:hypothetical protein